MKEDMAMARTVEPGWINLSVGEPQTLRWHMQAAHLIEDEFTAYVEPARYGEPIPVDLSYPPSEGLASLRDALSALPIVKKIGVDSRCIVVTTGAKQALYAAVYALRQMGRKGYLVHRAPYWPSYTSLARHFGVKLLTAGADIENQITINTSPNNPDGSVESSVDEIWDAAYASSAYGFDPAGPVPYGTFSVFSASKMYGISGARVGWLVASTPEFAKHAAQYVEATSAGVSVYSQLLLEFLVNQELRSPSTYQYLRAEAYAQLAANSARLRLLSPLIEEFSGFSRTKMGMFEMLKPKDPEHFRLLLNKAKVRVLDGEFCGMPGYFRVSLGGSPDQMKSAVRNILEATK